MERPRSFGPIHQPRRLGFDLALANSLDRANGWVLTESELKKLRQLCSSLRCDLEVANALWMAQLPVNIGAPPGAVGPYYFFSDEQLRHKLSQYPPGTNFRLGLPANSEDPDVRQTRQDIEAALRQYGHRLVN